MSEATPRPWQIIPGVYDTNPEIASEFPHGPEIIAANGEHVASCNMHGEEVAELIVNAVNGLLGSDPLSDLVNSFAAALLQKLRDAERKYGHNDGWLEADWEASCQRQLLEHVAKGDPRDVAAYCAFMWHHGWRTATAGQPDTQATISRLTAEREGLRAALQLLRNEVKGSWSLSEPSIREAIGNTNYNCVQRAIAEADAALATSAETDAEREGVTNQKDAT